MKHHNLAFIDLETTGLSPERHEIIEIGIILAKQTPREGKGPLVEIIEELELKVSPEHIEDADPQALKINGYDRDKWSDAISLGKAMETVRDETKDAILVGQNVSFDWVFLEKAFAKTGIQNKMHYHRIDLMSMAFAKLYNDPKAQRFSLRELCLYFGVKNEKAHSALSDIRATYEVYKKLLELP